MSGRGDGTIIAPAPRPRSGLGLNELLARRPAFGVEQNSRVFVLHIAWCRKPQELSPGVGHNPRVMAGALGENGAEKLLLGSLQTIFLCRANT